MGANRISMLYSNNPPRDGVRWNRKHKRRGFTGRNMHGQHLYRGVPWTGHTGFMGCKPFKLVFDSANGKPAWVAW